ncbi:MAG: flagellar repressor protein FlbT [Rhodospirillales bacterium]|nr:flagellar repressor protein FlbT [Rhodospirillales bacterium]
MPLKLDLKPGEKFILNGTVVQVGRDGRSLILQNEATLLRDRDVMQEDDANTPARRIYFVIMMSYIDPENAAHYDERLYQLLNEYMAATSLPVVKQSLLLIAQNVAARHHYRALKACKSLIVAEDELLKLT